MLNGTFQWMFLNGECRQIGWILYVLQSLVFDGIRPVGSRTFRGGRDLSDR